MARPRPGLPPEPSPDAFALSENEFLTPRFADRSVRRGVAAAPRLQGQDLEPRTYANTPVGLNFLIEGYGHSESGVATDPALPHPQDPHPTKKA